MAKDKSNENMFEDVANRAVLLSKFNLYFQSDEELFYMAINDTVIKFTPPEFFAFSFATHNMWGKACDIKFDEMMNKFLNINGNSALINSLDENDEKKLNFGRKLPKDSRSIFKEVNEILKSADDNRKKEGK